MRLQLSRRVVAACIGAIALGWTQTGRADAAPEVATRALVYADSNATTVWTSSTSAAANLSERTRLSAGYLVDVVSSASVDVVTQATQRIHDVRHEATAALRVATSERGAISARYAASTEHDWTSHNGGIGAAFGRRDGGVTARIDGTMATNRITLADSFGFERHLLTWAVDASVESTASRRDRLIVAATVGGAHGFQASPYRYLTIGGLAYAESLPEDRLRFAASLRHLHALGERFAIRSFARGYVDTFGVLAGTVELELAYEHGAFDVVVSCRAYAQRSAWFQEARYARQQRYMTLDKELATFFDVFLGLSLGYERSFARVDRMRVDARVRAFDFEYLTFAALARRTGVIAGLGLVLDL